MKVITLETAAKEIRVIVAAGKPLPFCFVVGAGISAPSIKIASKIEQEMRDRAIANDLRTPHPPAGADAMHRYAHWFEQAYPSREGRRRYLSDIIRDQPITPAVFRLAQLLVAKKLAHIVITPNFDDFVSRALTLIGNPHIVCDHPEAVERIDPESDEIQVVHVHGTYWFYDCANLPGELQEKARVDQSRDTSLHERLQYVFANRSPIVIGYSGWERDVIMEALSRRLKGVLRQPLYWFCFNTADFDGLPGFVRNHNDVRVVVSESVQASIDGGGVQPAQLELERIGQSITPQNMAAPSMAAESEPLLASAIPPTPVLDSDMTAPDARSVDGAKDTLPADTVLRTLVRSLDAEVPRLLQNPLDFFADQLRSAFPPHVADDAWDVLSFKRTLRRVEHALNAVAESFDEKLDPLVISLQRARPDDALNAAADIAWHEATAEQQSDFVDLVLAACKELNDNSHIERDGYALAAHIIQHLAAEQELAEKTQKQLRRALLSRGLLSDELRDTDDAVAAWDELLTVVCAADVGAQDLEPTALVSLAAALLKRGNDIQEDQKRAISLLVELERKFKSDPDDRIRLMVARGIGMRGYFELLTGRLAESKASFDTLLRDYAASEDDDIRAAVVSALNGRGAGLVQEGRFAEAIDAFREVLQRFGKVQAIAVQREVAMAYGGLITSLALGGQTAEAIERAEEAEVRFGDSPDENVRQRVASARVNALLALMQRGDPKTTIDTADAIIDASSPDNEQEEIWVGLAMMVKAISQMQNRDAKGAADTVNVVLKRFEDSAATIVDLVRAYALHLKGALKFDSGDQAGGLELMARVVEEFEDSPMLAARQQAAIARLQRAKLLLSGAEPARGVEALQAIADDERLLDREGMRGVAAAAAIESAVIHLKHGRPDEAFDAFEDVVHRFDQYDELNTRLNVANACWNQALILMDRGPDAWDGALDKLNETLQRTRGVRSAAFVERACFALQKIAQIHAFRGDLDAADATLDDAITLLDGANVPEDHGQRLAVRLQRTDVRRLQARYDKQAEMLDEIVQQVGDLKPRSALEFESAAAAFTSLSLLHTMAEQAPDGLKYAKDGEAYLARADNADHPGHAPRLLYAKMLALHGLERQEDAQSVARELLDRFGESQDPTMVDVLSEARIVAQGASQLDPIQEETGD